MKSPFIPRRRSALGWWFGAIVLALSSGSVQGQETSPYGPPEKLAELENQEITESSGLAASRRHERVFWTHNDSGNGPQLYACDEEGRQVAEISLAGSRNVDWEDMAAVSDGAQAWLVVGDIGDNNSRRESCTLYLLEEPELAVAGPVQARAVEFTYEDGPHDCEALAVDPENGDVLLIAKVLGFRCGLYRLPWPLPESDEPLVAEQIGTMRHTPVTALDISPAGDRAVVLSLEGAYEYTRTAGQTWAEAFAGTPEAIVMPVRRQGESICYGVEGDSLYLTSEHLPTPLWRLQRRAEQE